MRYIPFTDIDIIFKIIKVFFSSGVFQIQPQKPEKPQKPDQSRFFNMSSFTQI
jgi:hypothetical protein